MQQVEIERGKQMRCALLHKGVQAGSVPVKVLEIKRHWKTGEPISVRVGTLAGKKRFAWVQPCVLTSEVF